MVPRQFVAAPQFAGRALRALVVTVVLLLAAAVVPALGQEVDRDQLQDAKDEIAAVEGELEQARADREKASAALKAAERRLHRLEAAVNDVARALHQQELQVAEVKRRVGVLESRIKRQQKAFAKRAASMYKRGAGVPMEAVLSAGSMDDAIQRSAYVQAISSSDQANLEGISNARITLQAERRRLTDERDRLAAMKAERERLFAKVAELREDRQLKLAATRDHVHDLESKKENLEAASHELERRLKARERAREQRQVAAAQTAEVTDAAASQAVGASGYAWPRCDTVTSEYGYRWGRRHEGIDIDGSTGSPIYAAKSGVVISTGYQGGYGRLTLIEHNDGVVTGYAHQSAQHVSSGERVSQGQHIGAVGTTGNVTGAHLHFETRVHGSAVNPRRYLPGSC